MKRERPQFCIHGHDTFVCGRNKKGKCKDCVSLWQRKYNEKKYVPHPRVSSKICPRGHDKDITGKKEDGTCIECKRIYMIEYNKEYRKEHPDKKYISTPNTKCEMCSKEFYRSPNVKSKHKFCSQKCQFIFYRGENSPSWRGGSEAEYQRSKQQDLKRKQAYKQKAVDFMGGKCQDCGYNKCLAALDFHHLDPKTKDKDIKTLCNGRWERVVNELLKCVLICANCHRERHWKERHENT